jgi:hypothetical protein
MIEETLQLFLIVALVCNTGASLVYLYHSAYRKGYDKGLTDGLR